MEINTYPQHFPSEKCSLGVYPRLEKLAKTTHLCVGRFPQFSQRKITRRPDYGIQACKAVLHDAEVIFNIGFGTGTVLADFPANSFQWTQLK